MGIRPCYTALELEKALLTRWVIFNPHRMFPGNTKAAFRWWCKWVYDVCVRGPGKKRVLIDEVWQWQTNQQIPPELALIAQTGREENIELVLATQLPHRINAAIIGQSTEVVCFRTDERLALETIADLGVAPEKVQGLPLGSYVAYNRLSRACLAGRVF